MKQLFSVDGKLYKTLDIVSDILLANMLFIMCALPLVTVGASAIALWDVIYAVVHHEGIKVSSRFLTTFRSALRRGTLAWFIIVGTASVMLGIYWIFGSVTQGNQIILLVLLALCSLPILSCVYIFPLLARYEMSVSRVLRTAVAVASHCVWESIAAVVLFLVIICGVPLYAHRFIFLWFFFAWGGTAYLQSWFVLHALNQWYPPDAQVQVKI
ncbi:DUF624 domain-containing protein [Alloscardovia omnicolens]|uniref:DUF624 domain-containing protein n=1 Tax=Alloscardovia omnicolens TaxID=419015 RepID=UPI003A7A5A31